MHVCPCLSPHNVIRFAYSKATCTAALGKFRNIDTINVGERCSLDYFNCFLITAFFELIEMIHRLKIAKRLLI